jgi:hypothetical protein
MRQYQLPVRYRHNDHWVKDQLQAIQIKRYYNSLSLAGAPYLSARRRCDRCCSMTRALLPTSHIDATQVRNPIAQIVYLTSIPVSQYA